MCEKYRILPTKRTALHEFISICCRSEEEITLENYPCALEAGNYIVPKEDIYVPDEAGNPSRYLKKGLRCLMLTGNPQEPEIIWFQICTTGEFAPGMTPFWILLNRPLPNRKSYLIRFSEKIFLLVLSDTIQRKRKSTEKAIWGRSSPRPMSL